MGRRKIRERGRTRTIKARRKARKAAELHDPEQNKWMKYARCGICQGKMVVNNYADRKVRVNHMKIGGIIVCPWCKGRNGKGFVKVLLLLEHVARRQCEREDQTNPNCKCLPHTAGRVLDADFPAVRRVSSVRQGAK